MILEKDFLDFLDELNKNNVRYVLVGGYAAIINGVNRTTGDMDIFIDRTTANAEKVLAVIEKFGFGFLGFTLGDLMDENMVLQMGVSPIRIDILNSLPAITFEDTYNSAFDYTDSGITFKVIHINKLIENKTAVARGKDMEDVKTLKKIANKQK